MAKDNQYGFFRDILLTNGALNVNVVNGTLFSYTATNHTDLLTKVGMVDGDIAYVYNSEGTSWLPTTYGGTYYPQGIYVYVTNEWVSDRNAISVQLEESRQRYIVNVNQDNVSTTLGGTIDSTVEYFLDGVIDVTGIDIIIPSGGIFIRGYNFDISGLVCSDDNHTIFSSAVGGSGDILFNDFFIEASGVNSQVFDIYDSTGFHAIEINIVNYINCSSRGTIDNYRQGLESGTGYFGGTPELILKGTWIGGYLVKTSIVRNLIPGTYSLFSAGAGFIMNSRFKSDQNVDLPTGVSYIDFTPSNFPNASTLQLTNMIVSRNGIFNPDDTLLTPNTDHTDLDSFWKGNVGLNNTHVGGQLQISTEITTTINTAGTFETLLASWTEFDLEHFDSPSPGQLRHLGNTPREYKIISDIPIDGGANDDLTIRVRKFKFSDSSTSTVYTQSRQVNNFSGGRDVAFFNLFASVTLDRNDYVYYEITNNTNTTNVTAELDGFYDIEER